MYTKRTIFYENTMGRPFGVVGENGFGRLIETEDGNELLDTCQGKGICGNAAAWTKTWHRFGSLPSAMAFAITPGDCCRCSTRPDRCLPMAIRIPTLHAPGQTVTPVVTSVCATGTNASDRWVPPSKGSFLTVWVPKGRVDDGFPDLALP